MQILVTGVAGFIGFHLAERLLGMGETVTGIDNLNDYYDVGLKQARLELLKDKSGFRFIRADLSDQMAVESVFESANFDIVINLAAQAGVRYSTENPQIYINSNLVGFINILEGCRHNAVKHLVYASSSSVYGANGTVPFSEHHNVDHPVSLYAATKKANELMAHSYASLYGLPVTGLRFFTVYGPWGRPDMACFSFTRSIIEGKPVNVFNNGRMQRDFTYIDDIVEGIILTAKHPARPDKLWSAMHPDPGTSFAPYRIYNIGSNNPIELLHFIECLEKHLGIKAKKNFMPMQAGDLQVTFADVDNLKTDTGFRPETSIDDGIRKFVAWYRSYYGV